MNGILTAVAQNVTWEMWDTTSTCSCPVPWCDSQHGEQLDPNYVWHGRDIAAAYTETDLALEVCVHQGNPRRGLRDTGTSWAPNYPTAPEIVIYIYEDGTLAARMPMDERDAEVLIMVLRSIGEGGRLIEALFAACEFAKRIKRIKRRGKL
ncbi:hypothetical protein [Spirillospora sp. NBC_01491]|uniref:hypothetical protein n=1 Tax=Spirillospora sp. NBC_01491 TaxID=2976007 RepID=UPI002E369765|nr:hypothetical protein [Spirillospora sp. NBC_01491]